MNNSSGGRAVVLARILFKVFTNDTTALPPSRNEYRFLIVEQVTQNEPKYKI